LYLQGDFELQYNNRLQVHCENASGYVLDSIVSSLGNEVCQDILFKAFTSKVATKRLVKCINTIILYDLLKLTRVLDFIGYEPGGLQDGILTFEVIQACHTMKCRLTMVDT